MQLPNAGDDLQTIKRGVMELADIVLVNKADLDPDAATRVQAQITTTLRLIGHGGRSQADGAAPAQVLQVSALTGAGLDAFWQAVERLRAQAAAGERLAARRREQDQAWMWERIDAGLKARFRAHPAVRAALPESGEQVRAGKLAASVAARRLLDLFH
jgi:LAO/AO transport system kinase